MNYDRFQSAFRSAAEKFNVADKAVTGKFDAGVGAVKETISQKLEQRRERKNETERDKALEQAFNTEGFAEYLAKYPDARSLDMNRGEDLYTIAERFRVYQQKEKASHELENVYSKQVQKDIQLQLPPEAFGEMKAYLEQEAITNPEQIDQLVNKLESFQKYSEKISQHERHLEGALGNTEDLKELAGQRKDVVLAQRSQDKVLGFYLRHSKKGKAAIHAATQEYGIHPEQLKAEAKAMKERLKKGGKAEKELAALREQSKGIKKELFYDFAGGREVQAAAQKLLNEKLYEMANTNPVATEGQNEASIISRLEQTRGILRGAEKSSEGEKFDYFETEEQAENAMKVLDDELKRRTAKAIEALPKGSQTVKRIEQIILEHFPKKEMGRRLGEIAKRNDLGTPAKLILKRIIQTREGLAQAA